MSSHRSLWLGEGLGSTLCFCELAKLAFAQGPLTRIQICSPPSTAASAIHTEMQALFLGCGCSHSGCFLQWTAMSRLRGSNDTMLARAGEAKRAQLDVCAHSTV